MGKLGLHAGTLLMTVAAVVGVPAAAVNSRSVQGSVQPQLTGYQLLFMGQPVDQLVTGARTRRYRISLTGTGFEPSSKVFLNGQKVAANYVSATQLVARLLPGLTPAPGEISVQVVNPDGQGSGILLIDVISDPSVLSISTISPDVGLFGAQVVITGTGFTATGNLIRFRRGAPPFTQGFVADASSADGKTISFTLSGALCFPCAFTVPPCLAPCYAVVPGGYQVAVTNSNGISNSKGFVVSSTTGPIGVWGGGAANVRALVSDTRVVVDGVCFTGAIDQTLTLDAGGGFDLPGTYTGEVGPGSNPRPARFSGSVSGPVMTLTITLTGSRSLPLGPFMLVFGDDIGVPKLCL